MWNNINHGNINMNKFERLMAHKGHLERLAQIKKVINTKNPKTPSFIEKKMINPGYRLEREMKIEKENRILFQRMYELKNKRSPYSAFLNIPSKCPAYELLGYHRNQKKIKIQKENDKLYKRFILARPTYNAHKLIDEYEYSKYLERNIAQNKNYKNPNLEFITFEKFDERIKKRMRYNSYSNKNKTYDGSYNCNSRKTLVPSLTMNYQLKDECQENEVSNNVFNKSSKTKRPNSCKLHITIDRELNENSQIFNSEVGYNVSSKTYRRKPASGKTRTNGSHSINAMTSP